MVVKRFISWGLLYLRIVWGLRLGLLVQVFKHTCCYYTEGFTNQVSEYLPIAKQFIHNDLNAFKDNVNFYSYDTYVKCNMWTILVIKALSLGSVKPTLNFIFAVTSILS